MKQEISHSEKILRVVSLAEGLKHPKLSKIDITNQNNTTMTEINVFDSNGKIVFRSVEPRKLTATQVEAELEKWQVDTEHHIVQIIYN